MPDVIPNSLFPRPEPFYGAQSVVDATPSQGQNPPGLATIIPRSGTSIDKLDLWVTGWMEPNHHIESKIGTERIEDGSIITDHVVSMPAKLRLVGMVSDITMGPDSTGAAWNEVRRLHAEEEILQVITEYGVYKEMVIKSARTTQENRGMEFTLELQQIVRVGVSEISAAIGDPNNPAANMQPNVDAGEKELIEVPVTPLGNNRFRLGTAQDPAAQIIEYRLDENGNPITDESGSVRYFTVDPE